MKSLQQIELEKTNGGYISYPDYVNDDALNYFANQVERGGLVPNFMNLYQISEIYVILDARINYINKNEPEENRANLINRTYDELKTVSLIREEEETKRRGASELKYYGIGEMLKKLEDPKLPDTREKLINRLSRVMNAGWKYRQNITDEKGNTAMHLITEYTAMTGDLEPLKILFRQDPNQNFHRNWGIKNNEGVSAADLMRQYSEAILMFVEDHNFKESHNEPDYATNAKKEYVRNAIKTFGTEEEKGPDSPRTTIRDQEGRVLGGNKLNISQFK